MPTLQSTDAFSGLETDETLNSAQIDQRARTLRDQLTLDEKINLMHGQPPFWAFARVALAPRETRTVHLSVPATDLAYYDEATSKWRIEPIGYTAIVGRHALDPNALRTDFRVV